MTNYAGVQQRHSHMTKNHMPSCNLIGSPGSKLLSQQKQEMAELCLTLFLHEGWGMGTRLHSW